MELIKFLRKSGAELTLLEDKVWVLTKQIGVPAYDFSFASSFKTSHPQKLPAAPIIARIGPLVDYSMLYKLCAEADLDLINTPSQYDLVTDLARWFDLLDDLTARSRWWSSPPPTNEVEKYFEWPVFVKGERQTNRHSSTSVVKSAAEFDIFMRDWKDDPVLSWQKVVVREFLTLRKVRPLGVTTKVAPSFEFRTFWLNGELVGAGSYWIDFAQYDWTPQERVEGLECAAEAARRVNVPFLVIDIAQTDEGRWVVIELNEAQESGYSGVSPIALWRSILDKI